MPPHARNRAPEGSIGDHAIDSGWGPLRVNAVDVPSGDIKLEDELEPGWESFAAPPER
jgi:hypothetical protein